MTLEEKLQLAGLLTAVLGSFSTVIWYFFRQTLNGIRTSLLASAEDMQELRTQELPLMRDRLIAVETEVEIRVKANEETTRRLEATLAELRTEFNERLRELNYTLSNLRDRRQADDRR